MPSSCQSISRRPKTDFCSVFLPAAGFCNDTGVSYQGNNEIYWSSTPSTVYYAYRLNFTSTLASMPVYGRSDGCSVRAVLNESAK